VGARLLVGYALLPVSAGVFATERRDIE